MPSPPKLAASSLRGSPSNSRARSHNTTSIGARSRNHSAASGDCAIWTVPTSGDSPSVQLRELWRQLGIPVLALLLFLAATLLFPIPFALFYADGAATAFLFSSAISFLVGLVLFRLCRSERELSVREGFAIVTFGFSELVVLFLKHGEGVTLEFL